MTGKDLRRCLAAAAAVGSVAAGVVALSPLASASSKPHLSEAQILRLALGAAAANGDPRPTLIQHSAGTRYAANFVASHDLVPGSAWSYLIAERGKFVAEAAPRPAGAPAPRGSVITLIVNAATGQGTDGGISDYYPPLAKLGPVTTDLRTYSTCPNSDRKQLTSTAAGSGKALVPPGPRQVLLCRYSGLNPTPADANRLLAQRLIGSRQTVARLAGEFDALKPFQSGAYACPADFGVKIVAIFRYLPTPRSDDPVTLDPNGCAGVINGRVTRTALVAPGPALIGQLDALTATGP
jgi:hypothetical protein